MVETNRVVVARMRHGDITLERIMQQIVPTENHRKEISGKVRLKGNFKDNKIFFPQFFAYP